MFWSRVLSSTLLSATRGHIHHFFVARTIFWHAVSNTIKRWHSLFTRYRFFRKIFISRGTKFDAFRRISGSTFPTTREVQDPCLFFLTKQSTANYRRCHLRELCNRIWVKQENSKSKTVKTWEWALLKFPLGKHHKLQKVCWLQHRCSDLLKNSQYYL